MNMEIVIHNGKKVMQFSNVKIWGVWFEDNIGSLPGFRATFELDGWKNASRGLIDSTWYEAFAADIGMSYAELYKLLFQYQDASFKH